MDDLEHKPKAIITWAINGKFYRCQYSSFTRLRVFLKCCKKHKNPDEVNIVRFPQRVDVEIPHLSDNNEE